MSERNAELHIGHRKRMKKKIVDFGIDSLQDHEILEALLFYTMPQGDTNELAHTLLNEFGGKLVNVVNADYDKLLDIKGIGVHTASFFVLLRHFSKKYLIDSYCCEHLNYAENADAMCELCKRMFVGIPNEVIYAASLSSELDIISSKKLHDGGFDAAVITPRALIDFAISEKSNNIVIIHNHPRGSALPSREDISTTGKLVSTLRLLNVDIIDHIIVGRDSTFSMRSSLYAGEIWNHNDE
ncbi:MAG: RadC family protein [Ruminiclostridium sp.]|nr:RadC family protein [Ruminiclostridium sp.]